MKSEFLKIYRILSDRKYHRAIDIANKLNISDRTCRKHIKDLNDILIKNNLEIISKPRYGYIIKGDILKEKDIFGSRIENIPISSEDRIQYLLEKLIYSDSYIKLDDISEMIYTSTKTLSLNIKSIEKILENYGLKIERKPHYGIKLVGQEINIRNLLVDIYEKKLNENRALEVESKYKLDDIGSIAMDFFNKSGIKISDIALQNLVVVIYVSIIRSDKEILIEGMDLSSNDTYKKGQEEIKRLVSKLKLENILSLGAIKYITIHFLTKATLTYKNIENESIKEISDLIEEIVFYIKVTFKIDLSGDENFYKNLYSHLLALSIRLRFGIKVSNSLLDDIKKNMEIEYNISTYIANLISKRYNAKVSEDEIGYLAVIIHMAKGFSKKDKKNILIVCPTGRGISKFLMYTYRNEFSEDVNLVNSCSVNELKYMDLKDIDVVFTLVNLEENINKPTYMIEYFLDDKERKRIREILRSKEDHLSKMFPKELFVYFDKKLEKEEIIKIMSNKIKEYTKTKENLENLILEREKLGATEIYEEVAIPHPIKVIENINVIGVCILKEPIVWINNEVKLILFMCIDNYLGKNEMAYRVLTKIIQDKNMIALIHNNPFYEYYINTIKEMENKNNEL